MIGTDPQHAWDALLEIEDRLCAVGEVPAVVAEAMQRHMALIRERSTNGFTSDQDLPPWTPTWSISCINAIEAWAPPAPVIAALERSRQCVRRLKSSPGTSIGALAHGRVWDEADIIDFVVAGLNPASDSEASEDEIIAGINFANEVMARRTRPIRSRATLCEIVDAFERVDRDDHGFNDTLWCDVAGFEIWLRRVKIVLHELELATLLAIIEAAMAEIAAAAVADATRRSWVVTADQPPPLPRPPSRPATPNGPPAWSRAGTSDTVAAMAA